jgi:hypothetical protein
LDPDNQTTAKLAELKKQLEEITGHKINANSEQLLAFVFPIASSTYTTKPGDNDDVWVTSERLIFPSPICADGSLLDTSGVTETGGDGKIVFTLHNFLCGRLGAFAEPVNLLATPQGTSPRYVTMAHQLISNPTLGLFTDVQITACSWNPDGTAAPNVRFYWRCRVVANPIIE